MHRGKDLRLLQSLDRVADKRLWTAGGERLALARGREGWHRILPHFAVELELCACLRRSTSFSERPMLRCGCAGQA